MPGYTFDTDAQGWTTFDGATLTHEVADGNPGGHIRGVEASGGLWYFRTPDTLRGDLTGYFGGTIAFDLRQDYDTSQLNGDDLIIEGGGIRLVIDFDNPGLYWTGYEFDLEVGTFHIGTATGRIATREEILTALDNVTRFDIRGEFRSGADCKRCYSARRVTSSGTCPPAFA